MEARVGKAAGGAEAGALGGGAHARALQRALCVGRACLGGEEGEVVPTVLARGRWSVPEVVAAGTRGPRAPLGVVLSAGAHVHPTLLVHHPFRRCPGPIVRGFAPGTQPMGRAAEYSRFGGVWCGVMLRGVVWCGEAWSGLECNKVKWEWERSELEWIGVEWSGVVWCGGLWYGLVCPKALLPEGHGRDVYRRVQVNGRAVCTACALCVCRISAERGGEARLGGHPLGDCYHPKSSLPVRLMVQAQLLQHLRHRAVWAQAGLQQPGTCVDMGVPNFDGLLDDVAMNSVCNVWGPEHSMWACYRERVCNAAAHCSKTTGSHSRLHNDTTRLPTFWSGQSVSRRRAGLQSWDWPGGGAPFLAMHRRGGTWCLPLAHARRPNLDLA